MVKVIPDAPPSYPCPILRVLGRCQIRLQSIDAADMLTMQ